MARKEQLKPTKPLYETAIVEKRNVLNELRSNNMTVQELRFFSIYLSKINPLDKTTRLVRFPIEDFQRIMGFGRLNVKQLQASTDSLLQKLVRVPDENGRGLRTFQLFKECHIFRNDVGQWYVEIDAHDRALPLMFDFKNRYFKYELWNALRLKSSNQVRMYELLKQYESLGRRELTVQALREMLGISDNEYAGRTGWTDFKKKVLDSCQQALKECTDICYTYERGKVGSGGKWLTIIFHIQKNAEYKDQLTLDEFIELQPSSGIMMDADLVPIGEDTSDRLELLSDACKNEFTTEEMEQILQVLVVVPEWKLPENVSSESLELRQYHYLAERYAAMNRYSPKRNRFGYLLKILKDDAYTLN